MWGFRGHQRKVLVKKSRIKVTEKKSHRKKVTDICIIYLFIYLFICTNAIKVGGLYSQTPLSRTRLFRITAYLEVKIWFLF